MIDNRKQFVTEVLFLCVESNKTIQQKLGLNCEYIILCQTKYCVKQTSEMVLFVTITIANVVFYWAIVLHVQFLFMNFLFFCVSLWLSPSRSEVATRAVLQKRCS